MSAPPFDAAPLHTLLSTALPTKLRGVRWDHADKHANRTLSRTIADLAKAKMLGMLHMCGTYSAQTDSCAQKSSRQVSQGAHTLRADRLMCAKPGFKYIVQVQLVENLGQGGRADLACHWHDTDAVIQEIYSTVRCALRVRCALADYCANTGCADMHGCVLCNPELGVFEVAVEKVAQQGEDVCLDVRRECV